MADKREILEVLTILSAAYPRFELTTETISAYSLLLADLPADDLKNAALECATTKDFFPSVHEVRKAVDDFRRKRANIPNTYMAWEEVVRARPDYAEVIEENGQNVIVHTPHVWSHPLVEKVGKLLGWPNFPGDNLPTDRAHFFKAYEHYLSETTRDNLRLPEVTEYIDSPRTGPMKLSEGAKGVKK